MLEVVLQSRTIRDRYGMRYVSLYDIYTYSNVAMSQRFQRHVERASPVDTQSATSGAADRGRLSDPVHTGRIQS